MVWLYSYTSNLIIIGSLIGMVGLSLIVYIIALQIKGNIDSDDAETVLYWGIKMVALAVMVTCFPSLELIAENQKRFDELIKGLNESKIEKVEQSLNGELNEQIPSSLQLNCSQRVCRTER